MTNGHTKTPNRGEEKRLYYGARNTCILGFVYLTVGCAVAAGAVWGVTLLELSLLEIITNRNGAYEIKR
jgi:hypothetical protein